jgi:hypothetical protein
VVSSAIVKVRKLQLIIDEQNDGGPSQSKVCPVFGEINALITRELHFRTLVGDVIRHW